MKLRVVLAHHGLGDVLMAVPLLRACQDSLPVDESLLVLVKSRGEARVLSALPPGPRTEIRVLDRSGAAGLLRTLVSLRRHRVTMLLAPHATPGPGIALFARAVGASRSVGPSGRFQRLGFGEGVSLEPGMHKVEFYLRFAKVAGIATGRTADVRLFPSAQARSDARALLPGWTEFQRWIALAPGSNPIETHKRWPADRWAALASSLLDASPRLRVLLVGSAEERALLESIRRGFQAGPERAVVATPADPLVGLALIGHAECVAAGCSGAGHLAAAAGVPVVGLYGPTNPGFTGPYGGLRAIRAGLACSPCYRLDFIRGCGRPTCMSSIDVASVRDAVVATLAGVPAAAPAWLATTSAVEPAAPIEPQPRGEAAA